MPKDLLTFKDIEVGAFKVLNRCCWLENNLFLITNEEGIEKIIDIDNNFNEINFNARPLFNEISD